MHLFAKWCRGLSTRSPLITGEDKQSRDSLFEREYSNPRTRCIYFGCPFAIAESSGCWPELIAQKYGRSSAPEPGRVTRPRCISNLTRHLRISKTGLATLLQKSRTCEILPKSHNPIIGKIQVWHYSARVSAGRLPLHRRRHSQDSIIQEVVSVCRASSFNDGISAQT